MPALVKRAMLMAAGLGTRLRPFTDREPKALVPLLGVPMAQFALDALAHAGVEKVVANVHHHAEAARAGLSDLDHDGAELVISDESSQLLGSGGGIRKALPYFDGEPFFMLNADVLSEIDLAALAAAHARLRGRWGVSMTLAVHRAGPSPGGYREIFLDPDTGLIRGFGELASGRPFFIGAAVLEPEAVAHLPERQPSDFVPLVLRPAVERRRAGFFLTQGMWKDVGAPDLWLDAHLDLIRALETGRIPGGWRRRLENSNRRIAQEAWVSSRAPRILRASRWSGPCYWDGAGRAPEELGPRAVLYGEAPAARPLSDGIGRHGLWYSLRSRDPA